MRYLYAVLILAATTVQASELDRAAAALPSFEANFTQSFTPKGFRNAQTESGAVLFGMLPMMRFTYMKPEQKLFVFDGEKSWFYSPSDRQVTVARIDDARKQQLPFLMIGDPVARDRAFVVRENASRGRVVTTLHPRDPAGMIRTASLTVDPSTHLIQSIEYTDREGNRTRFDFSGYHRATPGPNAFQFTPPAGVQVVNAE
ncbi:MAG: outer membrane lipoprotein chaperone LolA [Thermoanaerobaculia bacterium]